MRRSAPKNPFMTNGGRLWPGTVTTPEDSAAYDVAAQRWLSRGKTFRGQCTQGHADCALWDAAPCTRSLRVVVTPEEPSKSRWEGWTFWS